MFKNTIRKIRIATAIMCAFATFSNITNATIVQFETSLGDFQVNLYDETTPESVANFLDYVTAGSYNNAIIHRSVSGFITQGGGFSYNGSWPAVGIATNAAVTNEPIYANVRGTIAYAKLGGLPNSATNQWFFNLGDNTVNLDSQNSGFTVFGEVMGNGMDVIDSIAALNTYNLGGAFSDIPLQNYTEGTDPNDTNIILITSIEIADADANTASGLNPTLTTRTDGSSSSGGGSFSFLMIILLAISSRLNKKRI